MATVQKNACAPEPALVRAEVSAASASGMPSPDDLPQAYSELQQRFQRTTNALGSAAHDLKTPLAILNGYVELLYSEKLGPVSERQREVLREMQASGKRLQQFIQDFLTYSALETGGLKMQFVVGNINECLSEVCRLWSMRFQEKKDWHFISWPTTSCRNLNLIFPNWNALSRICWRTPSQVRSAGWNGVVACGALHVGKASGGEAIRDGRAPQAE